MKWVKSIVNTVIASIKSTHRADMRPYDAIDVCMLSDIGCRRAQNEDHVLYIKPGEGAAESEKGFLAIVADGMGGHKSGRIASRMAVEFIGKYYYQSNNNPLTSLKHAFVDANKEIFLTAQQNDDFKGMGTTCTALIIVRDKAFISHVGDSRLYLIRNNQIEQMTEDHTFVNELVKQGVISLKEAEKHPDKNLVTRAMGTRGEVEFFLKGPFQILPDDRFMLCSDGLYDLINDGELKEAVLSYAPHEACEYLIDLSKKRGGYDNISVGVIAISPPDRHNDHKTMTTTRFD